MKLLSVVMGLSVTLSFLELNVLSHLTKKKFVLIHPVYVNYVRNELPPDEWNFFDEEYIVTPEMVCKRIKNAQLVVSAVEIANNTSLHLIPLKNGYPGMMLLRYDDNTEIEINTIFCESDDNTETYIAVNNGDVIVLWRNKSSNKVRLAFVKELLSYESTGIFFFNYFPINIAADSPLQVILKMITTCISFFRSLSSSVVEVYEIYHIFYNLIANDDQLQLECHGVPYEGNANLEIEYTIDFLNNDDISMIVSTNKGVDVLTYYSLDVLSTESSSSDTPPDPPSSPVFTESSS